MKEKKKEKKIRAEKIRPTKTIATINIITKEQQLPLSAKRRNFSLRHKKHDLKPVPNKKIMVLRKRYCNLRLQYLF